MHSLSRLYALRLGAALVLFLVGLPASAQTPTPATPTPTSPLAIHVGDADLLFGGFIDATAIIRDANTGSGLGTSFGTIPFGNTVQGNMGDTQFTAQGSRLTLQATTKFGTADLDSALEVDFLGNAPTGLNVTANANTPRLRVLWGRYRQGRYEFMGGQSWSLMTPNRSGLSPQTADVFVGQTVDPNFQMGLTWARTTQFRFTMHPTDVVTAAVSIENPDQYVGSGVKLPASFPSGEVDAGSAVNDVPNSFPDFIGKVAFDPKTGKTRQHVDGAVLVRHFKTYDQSADASFTKTAAGGEVSAIVQPVVPVRVIAMGFFSSGGGRYIANTNLPDFIVHPDASMTLVTTRAHLFGTEIQAAPRTSVFVYYSAAHADSELTTDVDGSTIGFGVPGSTAANEDLKETTAGIVQTFFRDPKIGGIQFLAQYSHVRRSPFSVPDGTPTTATVNMIYLTVRYFLP